MKRKPLKFKTILKLGCSLPMLARANQSIIAAMKQEYLDEQAAKLNDKSEQ